MPLPGEIDKRLETKRKQPYGDDPVNVGVVLIAEIFYGTVMIFTHPIDPGRMALPSTKEEGWSDIQDRAWSTSRRFEPSCWRGTSHSCGPSSG